MSLSKIFLIATLVASVPYVAYAAEELNSATESVSVDEAEKVNDPAIPLESHFNCKDLGGGNFRPYFMQAINGATQFKDWSQTSKGLLGQNAMKSHDECARAVEAANAEFGVICSRTGLDGWKPTLYTGTVPGRADFGYLGGSTIEVFENCLMATKNSSSVGVCFWGGSDWYVSPIDREGVVKGPFKTLNDCVAFTAPPTSK